MSRAASPALLLDTFKLVGEEVAWRDTGTPVPFRPNAEGYCLVSVPSGHRGGLYLTRYGKFVAKVTLRGRVHHLGTFTTPDEAAQAATLFRKSHHGEFFAAP